jgi:hypothetical protein
MQITKLLTFFFYFADHFTFWMKYAYLWGAAADTGYNFNLLVIFIAFSAVKTIPMANWVRRLNMQLASLDLNIFFEQWGNNVDSVERCRFSLFCYRMAVLIQLVGRFPCSNARNIELELMIEGCLRMLQLSMLSQQ